MELQTVNSQNSLIYWVQNINGSNISNVSRLILKNNYISVFKKLFEYTSKDGVKPKFLDIWHAVVNDECDTIYKILKQYSADTTSINRVVNKFRGNVGEILAEKIFKNFGSNFDIDGATYIPVDPTNEEFVDAIAMHAGDNFPMGIQIKNYTKNFVENGVMRETFVKSMAMTTHWCQNYKNIDFAKLGNYLAIPRQIIFSFTNVKDTRVLDDYKGSIKFIGPREIKPLNLEQKPHIFEQIMQKILNVN